jgi:PAS domain S-box-containing protein
MADAAPVMLWVTSPAGECTFLSRAWYEFTGQSESEALGFGWLDAVHPDDRQQAHRAFREANEKRVPFSNDYRLRARDGRYRWAIDAAQPWVSPTGTFLGYVGAVLDIGDRKEAEQQALAANRAKDEFLAMLGHELRNPLSPIVTSLHLMRLRGRGGPELDVIERQVNGLIRLVDDLLDVSRITGGKINLRRERVRIGDVVGRAVEMASPLLEQRRQLLQLDVPPEELAVEGDVGRLAQVLSNLLTNAAKYSEPSSTIRVRARRGGDHVELSVIDEGIGIAPEMLERIFDTFVQEPQALDRAKGGLGLGLSIVRGLVELHAGRVRASSGGPGKGTQVTVELPVAPAAEAGSVGLEVMDAVPREPVPGRRILVVDDNRDAADTVAEALASSGHEVRVAHDGPTALAVAGTFHPDVCIVDIGLPIMDGYELARALREAGLRPAPRLIAVTGYGQETDRRRALEAGFDSHVVKPVAFDQLERTIHDVGPPGA